MATISSGIAMDANIMNLKEISLREVRPEVSTLMVGGENMVRKKSLLLLISVLQSTVFWNRNSRSS